MSVYDDAGSVSRLANALLCAVVDVSLTSLPHVSVWARR